MKLQLPIATILILLCSCGSQQADNKADSLPDIANVGLSVLEAELVGRWDFYQVREILNAPPVYTLENRSDFSKTRKDDWIEFGADRTYRENYFGEEDAKLMWFEADDVTMRYQLLNQNDEVLRIEHYDFKGADTLLTSMDNAQFVWVKK